MSTPWSTTINVVHRANRHRARRSASSAHASAGATMLHARGESNRPPAWHPALVRESPLLSDSIRQANHVTRKQYHFVVRVYAVARWLAEHARRRRFHATVAVRHITSALIGPAQRSSRSRSRNAFASVRGHPSAGAAARVMVMQYIALFTTTIRQRTLNCRWCSWRHPVVVNVLFANSERVLRT